MLLHLLRLCFLSFSLSPSLSRTPLVPDFVDVTTKRDASIMQSRANEVQFHVTIIITLRALDEIKITSIIKDCLSLVETLLTHPVEHTYLSCKLHTTVQLQTGTQPFLTAPALEPFLASLPRFKVVPQNSVAVFGVVGTGGGGDGDGGGGRDDDGGGGGDEGEEGAYAKLYAGGRCCKGRIFLL